MSISNVIALLGGVALFLFGMSLMGDGLKQAAGNKMEMVLYRLSGTPVKGVLLGTAVTALIQSSCATSAMVVGFVNSAMMNLRQAISVIMGSMIGTSVTGWIIALSEIGSGTKGWISLVSTATLTGVIAIIGIIMRMTAKTQVKKHLSLILLGFAVLMYGMSAMSGAVAPLKESEKFINLMMAFSNPFLGILLGIAVTAVLQSASSAVGLMQALAITGAIDFEIAFPILLGINIGASVPVLMSSIGARTDAKRAAFSYFLISVLGSLASGIVYYAVNSKVHFSFDTAVMDAVAIALVNSLFRIFATFVLFPFMKVNEKLLVRLIPEKEAEEDSAIPPLEERFLANPAIALEYSHEATDSMAQLVGRTLNDALQLLFTFDQNEFDSVEERENIADRYEDKLNSYLVKISSTSLSTKQAKDVSKYLHVVGDLERISDHAFNLAETAQELEEKNIHFSPVGRDEAMTLIAALAEVVGLAFDAFVHDDVDTALRVEPLEELIDNLCDEMKSHHIDRLQQGICTIEHGYVFNDMLTNIERVSDHCSNIALAVIEADRENFDAHEYIDSLKELNEESFAKYYDEYAEKYHL